MLRNKSVSEVNRKVVSECDFCRILEYVAENKIAEVYNNYYDVIQRRWEDNRTTYERFFNQPK